MPGVFLVLMGLGAPYISGIPELLLGPTWINPVSNMLPLAIAALGINILVGVTGQVSLGHASSWASGPMRRGARWNGDEWQACVPFHEELGVLDEEGQCGLGLPMWIWLPSSGLAAAAVGIFVSPAAMKVRGLYLAIVTVGLVFIGLHLGRMFPNYAGDFESGRKWPTLDFRLWKEEDPLVAFTDDGRWFGLFISAKNKAVLLAVGTGRALHRLGEGPWCGRTGQALRAIRTAISPQRSWGFPSLNKRLGFALSSFYAGLAALWASYSSRMSPVNWSLFLGGFHRHLVDRGCWHDRRHHARHRVRRTHPRGGQDLH